MFVCLCVGVTEEENKEAERKNKIDKRRAIYLEKCGEM